MPQIRIIKKSCEPIFAFYDSIHACGEIDAAEEIEGVISEHLLKILEEGKARTIAYQALLEKLHNEISNG